MGRHRVLTQDKFREAYERHNGIVGEIAKALNLSRPTIYQYCKRFGFSPRLAERDRGQMMAVYNDYHGYASLKTLARKHRLHHLTVKYHIVEAINHIWAHDPPMGFPKPESVYDVKIVKALLQNMRVPVNKAIPSYELGRHLRLSQNYIDRYLQRMNEANAAKASKASKKAAFASAAHAKFPLVKASSSGSSDPDGHG